MIRVAAVQFARFGKVTDEPCPDDCKVADELGPVDCDVAEESGPGDCDVAEEFGLDDCGDDLVVVKELGQAVHQS